MRSKYALFNSFVGIISFFITGILGFISRSVMIPVLGVELVGITATFSDILNFLNISEMGLLSAVSVALYKPIHEKQYSEIKGILLFYKKLYRYGGILFTSLSVLVSLNFLLFFNSPYFSGYTVAVYFSLMAINTSFSYFFSYRLVIMSADQKMLRLKYINILFRIVTVAIKLGTLIIYRSFVIFLIVELISNILYISVMNILIKLQYKEVEQSFSVLNKDTKEKIVRMIKGLLFHKVGGFAVTGSNNIYVAIFSGFTNTALLSNYQMIINVMSGVLNSLFTAITSSIGNAIITDDSKATNSYKTFRLILFLNFFLVSVCFVGFVASSNFLISFWIGEKYELPLMTVIFLSAYFYFMNTRLTVGQFLNAAGICYEDRYIPLIEAAVNTLFCIILGRKYGMIGVIAGNLASTILIVYWQKPWLAFKYIFKRSPIPYFRDVIIYIVATGISLLLSMLFIKIADMQKGILAFVITGSASVLLTTVVYCVMFFRTKPFKDAVNLVLRLINISRARKR